MPEAPAPAIGIAQPGPRPLRVVLVDDDPLVRQLLAMVWDDYLLDLQPCTAVGPALAALRTAPADLIVTDLMLPGRSGLDLLAQLAAEPALRGTARIAVFSAGIDAATLARLQAFGVWRVLRKPLPVGELQACLLDAGAALRPMADAEVTGPRAPATACAAGPADGAGCHPGRRAGGTQDQDAGRGRDRWRPARPGSRQRPEKPGP